MNSLVSYKIDCPYCGESFETSIDTSQGSQNYFEDCYVCCRPIRFIVNVAPGGELDAVACLRDDE